MSKPPKGIRAVPDQLLQDAKRRTRTVRLRIERAIATIETELEENERIYPQNGGRLTQAEVCRRAGVRKTTLQGKCHRDTTKKTLDAWLAATLHRTIVGSSKVRKEVTSRATYWKNAHEAIAQKCHVYHLQIETLEERLRVANQTIAELRQRLKRRQQGRQVA